MFELVAPSSSATGDFPTIAGQGVEGTFMAAAADARGILGGARSWRDSARMATSLSALPFMLMPLRKFGPRRGGSGVAGPRDGGQGHDGSRFDTVLGQIGFDERGDVTGFEPWQWYVWRAEGTYVPVEQSITNK